MSESMGQASKTMKLMNRRMNLPQFTKIMQEFARESEMMDMKEDLMSDMMDDVMAEDEDVEEEDTIVQSILDEIGINLNQQVFQFFADFHIKTSLVS